MSTAGEGEPPREREPAAGQPPDDEAARDEPAKVSPPGGEERRIDMPEPSDDAAPKKRKADGGAAADEAAAPGDGAEEEDGGDKKRKKKAEPRRWTQVEDAALCVAVKQHGECNWKSIAAAVGSRNHMQCLQRWKKVLKPGLVKGNWTRSEDETLARRLEVAARDPNGMQRVDWPGVASLLPLRSARECRERWKYCLSPLAHGHRDAAGREAYGEGPSGATRRPTRRRPTAATPFAAPLDAGPGSPARRPVGRDGGPRPPPPHPTGPTAATAGLRRRGPGDARWRDARRGSRRLLSSGPSSTACSGRSRCCAAAGTSPGPPTAGRRRPRPRRRPTAPRAPRPRRAATACRPRRSSRARGEDRPPPDDDAYRRGAPALSFSPPGGHDAARDLAPPSMSPLRRPGHAARRRGSRATATCATARRRRAAAATPTGAATAGRPGSAPFRASRPLAPPSMEDESPSFMYSQIAPLLHSPASPPGSGFYYSPHLAPQPPRQLNHGPSPSGSTASLGSRRSPPPPRRELGDDAPPPAAALADFADAAASAS
ncbi:RNA polymerase II transcription regulator recruiting protein [Aureococcus anophagefferens]|nr:RNA polymerase II transcription regulator recruiting protein [Aureococcus anophagefferens]